MPRYLTPLKICLLVVIDLYIEESIPSAARLDVLSFVASQTHAPSDLDESGIEERAKLYKSDVTSFAESLSKWHSGIPGRTVYDIFLQRTWALNDMDSLHNLFHKVSDLVAPATPDAPEAAADKISRASPIGQFIRRCNVEFTRLQFSDSQAMCGSLAAFRAPSHDVWAARNPEAARQLSADLPTWATSSLDTPASSSVPEDLLFTSAEDTEALLNISVHHLQKNGTRVPPSVRQHLSHWISDLWESSAQSLQHFLAFFEHWRAGQYTMALESLHRYFDYSLVARGPGKPQGAGESGMKTYYQYALLHLSVLHADFERWGESSDALGECIATARENQDPDCLNFALSYLLYLRQTQPQNSRFAFSNLAKLVGGGPNDQDEIVFLKTKAKDGKHWSLLSSTLLEEAKREMYAGRSVNKALDCIMQSEYLNMDHDIRYMMPAGAQFRAGSLERLGQTSLSSRIHESIGIVHRSHCPLADDIRASCRVAHDLACSGRYDKAMEVLREAKDDIAKGVLKLEQRLLVSEMLVMLRKSCHAEDFDSADYHLEQLRPARAFGDSDAIFEITLVEVELLLKKREYEPALHIVNMTIQQLKHTPRTDIAHRLHLLTLKARIFAAAGQPVKGLSIALRAASTAERYFLIPVLVEALAGLGGILIALSQFGAARDLMISALPHAIEGRHADVTARLFAMLAQAIVGVAGHQYDMGSAEQVKTVRIAGGYVERSYQVYAQLQELSGMLHCLALKAKLARWSNDEGTASQADDKYIQLLADHTAALAVGGSST